MQIDESEIFAYQLRGKIYCKDCVEKEGLKDEITFDDAMLRQDVESDESLQTVYFCSLCKRLIE